MRILDVDHPNALREAAHVLRGGGLVAFPTETVYGLGARAMDPRAIAKVFAAKGRPASHPLIVHALDASDARRWAKRWPPLAERLASALWPGPLTLVVARADEVPAEVAGGGDSIAIRAPAHPVARALIAELGEPIAAPSANRYQSISPTTAQHVVASLGDAVDFVLDGGACTGGIESTVVDVREEVPVLLRPGGIDRDTISRVAGVEVRAGPTIAAVEHEPRPSPGMDARHYAPRARLVTIDRAELSREALGRSRSGERVGVIARGPIEAPGAVIHVLSHEATTFARSLYATLHELDAAGVDVILVEEVPDDAAWEAIKDRLERAGSPT